ncbi:hypothetical protein ACH347_34860 [Saccharopolyspora sp. 5N102]|uniref:hypothetical protein n=1 Tax=Saccharopolyspora sp. 5N102 TaxID=3375155 RepID=UPI0037B63C50
MDVEELIGRRKKYSRKSTVWLLIGFLAAGLLVLINSTRGGRQVTEMSASWNFSSGFIFACALVTVVMATRALRQEGKARRAVLKALTAEAEREEQEPITGRIDLLTANLSDSRRLIEDISAELEVRGEALKRLASEAEEKRSLAALHANEAAAVDALVNRRIQENVQRLERGSRRQQWLFFVLGSVLVAVPVGVVGNYVFEWLTK